MRIAMSCRFRPYVVMLGMVLPLLAAACVPSGGAGTPVAEQTAADGSRNVFLLGEVGTQPGPPGRQRIIALDTASVDPVRYRIDVSTTLQLALSPDATRLYVADADAGIPSLRRLDGLTGRQATSVQLKEGKNLVWSRSGVGSLAATVDNKILLLYFGGSSRPTTTWVEMRDGDSLRPVSEVAVSICGDLLLAGGPRFAVICRGDGKILLVEDSRQQLIDVGTRILDADMDAQGQLALLTDAGAAVVRRNSTEIRALGSAGASALRSVVSLGDGRVAIAALRPESRLVLLGAPSDVRVALPAPPAGGRTGSWPLVHLITEAGLVTVDLETKQLRQLPELDLAQGTAVLARR